MRHRHPTRRTFLRTIAYAGATVPILARSPLRAASPNSKVNLAIIGARGQSDYSFDNLMDQNIVAVADVDALKLNERRELLRSHETCPQDPALYGDYRQMLDKEQANIDAFVVATPDHHHAQAALRGMAMGKHCYCEKPLAHTIHEVRLMMESARRNRLVTQMGTQIHAGSNYRRVVEKIQAGVIGTVTEVQVWLYGAAYRGERFPEKVDPVPATLDWDLWLGPAAERPYFDKLYHPFNWRGWWDFGGGGTTDMACHFVDLPHWALGLSYPASVQTFAGDADPIRATTAMMVEMNHAGTAERPAVKVTWHLGGTHVDRVNVYEKYGIPDHKYEPGELPEGEKDPYKGSKICFVGTEGRLLADYNRHDLFPLEKFAGLADPPSSIGDSPGHHAEWIAGIREGTATLCNFDYSGALTEAVLLGIVSHRAGNMKVEYDAGSGTITNPTSANEWLNKPYREGWEIDRLA